MAKRGKMRRSESRRDFRRKAGVHPKNSHGMPVMRGGYRL